jgi:hypothetical protein
MPRHIFCAFSAYTLVLFLWAGNAASQTSAGPQYLRADNAVIAVAVEKTTGQFRVETAAGTPLLFRGEKGVTGFTNVHYGNNTYTSNLLQRPAPPRGSRAMQNIRVEKLPDRIRIHAVLTAGGDTLLFRQDLLPSLDGDYAYVNIITELENRAAASVRAGVLMMQDVMIGEQDSVDMTVAGNSVTHERDWRAATVPSEWEARVALSPYIVRGRLESATADRPDRFTAGNWQFHGYLGTAVWDYVPSGRRITDDAVLLQWDDEEITPGATRTLRTDYGFLAFSDLTLACNLPPLQIAEDSASYSPSPIPASATVTNSGALPLSNIDIGIALPAELQLVAGEPAMKSLAGPLLPGMQSTVTWMLLADAVDTATIASVQFDITAPVSLQRQCVAETTIPPLAIGSFTLDCGDTIRLSRAEEKAGYAPDPFTISVVVRNTGKSSLRNLQAELQLPPQLVLTAGSSIVPVLPDPLPPAAVAVVNWTVRAIIQPLPTVAPFSVRVFGNGADDACGSAVLIPPYILDPCIEAGVNTSGTEFWLAFLPDQVGAADEYLRVFVSAPEGADVTAETMENNRTQQLSLSAGALEAFDFDITTNDLPVETPMRKGVLLRSDRPVHLFAGNFRDRHSDGWTVLPTHALGTRYVTAGYNFAEAYEHLCVLGTEDGTDVTITPSSFTSTNRPGGQSFSITLDAGEVYYVKSFVAGQGGSLTGTVIDAAKPVAVFSGAESGWVPVQGGNPSAFLNPLAEQMIPQRYLGREYVAVPFRSRDNGDTYRVVATEDNTSVTVGNAPAVSLPTAGSWTEDILSAPAVIKADKPVLVAQYANSASWDADTNEYGDGSMLILVPTDRYMNCHYFPAGMLLADVDLQPNISVSVDDESWLETADTPQLSSPVFTAECWLFPLGGGTVVSRQAMPDARWELQYDFNRARLSLVIGRPPSQQFFHTRDNLMYPGRWAHVALVMNGPAGTARLYVNSGEEIDASFTATDFAGSGGLAWGGIYGVSTEALLAAQFDECRFWHIERSAGQIANAMGRRLDALDRAGLVGYWPFCEGYSDETLYSHDLQPQGNPILQQSWGLSSTLNCEELDDSSFVNLVLLTGSEPSCLVNFETVEASAFTAIPGGYSVARLKLPTGINRIESSDARGVGATSYGFAYHDAYTTYTGFRVSGQTQHATMPPVPGGLKLSAPWPSPLRESGHVSLSLPVRTPARLSLTDVAGRTLRSIVAGSMNAGEHVLPIDLRSLPAGRYFLRFEALGFVLQQPLVLLR